MHRDLENESNWRLNRLVRVLKVVSNGFTQIMPSMQVFDIIGKKMNYNSFEVKDFFIGYSGIDE